MLSSWKQGWSDETVCNEEEAKEKVRIYKRRRRPGVPMLTIVEIHIVECHCTKSRRE